MGGGAGQPVHHGGFVLLALLLGLDTLIALGQVKINAETGNLPERLQRTLPYFGSKFRWWKRESPPSRN